MRRLDRHVVEGTMKTSVDRRSSENSKRKAKTEKELNAFR